MIICADDSSCTRECMRINVSLQNASMSFLGFMPYRQRQVGGRRMPWCEGYRKAVYGKTVRTV